MVRPRADDDVWPAKAPVDVFPASAGVTELLTDIEPNTPRRALHTPGLLCIVQTPGISNQQAIMRQWPIGHDQGGETAIEIVPGSL